MQSDELASMRSNFDPKVPRKPRHLVDSVNITKHITSHEHVHAAAELRDAIHSTGKKIDVGSSQYIGRSPSDGTQLYRMSTAHKDAVDGHTIMKG